MDIVNSTSKVDSLIRQNNTEFIEKELRPFLRIPSCTLSKDGINRTKKFLISYLSDFAEDIKEHSGIINPLITAKVRGNLNHTILIYMMYDTQPIDREEDWISDPFDAEIRILPSPLKTLGKCIIARGAYNSKTPLISFLNVVKELKKRNKLPISLLLLFDGEEEKGSPGLPHFLQNNKVLFKHCKDAYYPSTKQDIDGTPVLKLGYKGILSITIIVHTKNKKVHSAFSSLIPNPTSELVSLLNTIYFKNEFLINSLKIPYKLTDDDKIILRKLKERLDLEKIKKKAGISDIYYKNPGKAFSAYLFNPTFNISTLKSGYLDEGIKNMVPNQAICNIDIRFAHNISVDDIYFEIQKKVDEFAENSKCKFNIIRNSGYNGSRVRKDSVIVESLIESFKGLSCEIWPISAAAAPLSEIQHILKINFITGGLGIGGYAHSANEFIQYDSIINIRLSNYNFLKNYSEFCIKNQ